MVRNEFKDISQGYPIMVDDVLNGMDVMKTKEQMAYHCIVLDSTHNILDLPGIDRNWKWILAEARDRFYGLNPGTAFNWDKNWKNRVEENGLFSYSYGERLIKDEQLDQAIKMISKGSNTRECFVTIWDQKYLPWEKRRVPCSIGYQFMHRAGFLNVFYTMRSSDIKNMFPSDFFQVTTLLRVMASELGMKPGQVSYFAGSAHIPQRSIPIWEKRLKYWKKNDDNIYKCYETNDMGEKALNSIKTPLDFNGPVVENIFSSHQDMYFRNWALMDLLIYDEKHKKEKYLEILGLITNEFQYIAAKYIFLELLKEEDYDMAFRAMNMVPLPLQKYIASYGAKKFASKKDVIYKEMPEAKETFEQVYDLEEEEEFDGFKFGTTQ